MCEFERNYEVDISFFGKIQVIHQSKAEIIFEKDEIVSIDDFYYPISSDILNKLNTYENEIKEAEKAVKKEAEEIKQAKSYIPNKTEFNKRILEVFPEVNNWNKVGNSKVYKDPNNSKNIYMFNEDTNDSATVLQINDNIKQAQFIGNENKITLADGGELTEKRYKQMIELAFGDAPDYLKICDLETFKEKAVVEGDYIRKTYTAKFKGINYVWQIEYRDGVYNGYYFKIYI